MLLKDELSSSDSYFPLIIPNHTAASCNPILNDTLYVSNLYSRNYLKKKNIIQLSIL